MSIKVLGALAVIAGCGGFGFLTAASHRQTEKYLRQLIRALDFMECELQFRLTPLPELCRETARELDGMIGNVFSLLAQELDSQIAPEAESCMAAAVHRAGVGSELLCGNLKHLGKSLGRFDLSGQLKGLEGVRGDCRRQLDTLSNNRDVRLRSYQTLGLCAGAALAILFL